MAPRDGHSQVAILSFSLQISHVGPICWLISNKQNTAEIMGCHFWEKIVKRMWLLCWYLLPPRPLSQGKASSHVSRCFCRGVHLWMGPPTTTRVEPSSVTTSPAPARLEAHTRLSHRRSAREPQILNQQWQLNWTPLSQEQDAQSHHVASALYYKLQTTSQGKKKK